jgi:hypothetical protein
MAVIIGPFHVSCSLCDAKTYISSRNFRNPERATIFADEWGKQHKCPVKTPQRAIEPEQKSLEARWNELFRTGESK